MTHVTIMTLSYIVSEIQTDGQAKCIYRYIYTPPGIFQVDRELAVNQGFLYHIDANMTLKLACVL